MADRDQQTQRTAQERGRLRAWGATIGAGALAPAIYGVVGDMLGVPAALFVIAAIVLLTLPLALMLKPVLPARRA